jgi:hypothetical protein
MSYRDPSSIPEVSEDKPDVQAHGPILRSLDLGLSLERLTTTVRQLGLMRPLALS